MKVDGSISKSMEYLAKKVEVINWISQAFTVRNIASVGLHQSICSSHFPSNTCLMGMLLYHYISPNLMSG